MTNTHTTATARSSHQASPETAAQAKEALDRRAGTGDAIAIIIRAHGELRTGWQYPSWNGQGAGAAEECPFTNALVLTNDGVACGHDLQYVDGFAYNANTGRWTTHAWAEDSFGTVYETTWNDGERSCYIGLPFDRVLVGAACLASTLPMTYGDNERTDALLEQHHECCRLW